MPNDEYGNPECKGCIYSTIAGRYRICDYFLTTGKRRPCPPDEPCTVKKVEGKKQPKAMEIRSRGRKADPQAVERWRELYNQGLNDHQIAEQTGYSPPAIQRWRQKQGLPVNVTRRENKKDFPDRMELYNRGMSDGQIAKALGITPRTVLTWRKRNGLPALYKPCSGKRIGLEG